MLAETDLSVGEMVNAIIAFVSVAAIFVGMFTGRYFERKHLNSLEVAEADLSDMHISNSKVISGTADQAMYSSLVEGQVVIANDALKSFFGAIKSIFGGEMHSYETLMERARREAIVRMLCDARAKGYNAVYNLRLNFSSIRSGNGKNTSPAVEVLVTATAYKKK